MKTKSKKTSEKKTSPAKRADKAARKAQLRERLEARKNAPRGDQATAQAVVEAATKAATAAVVSAVRGSTVKPRDLRSSDLKAVGAAVTKAAERAAPRDDVSVKEETFKDFVFKRVAQGQPTKRIADAIMETFGPGGPRSDYRPGLTRERAVNHARWYRGAAVREGVISKTRSKITARD